MVMELKAEHNPVRKKKNSYIKSFFLLLLSPYDLASFLLSYIYFEV